MENRKLMVEMTRAVSKNKEACAKAYLPGAWISSQYRSWADSPEILSLLAADVGLPNPQAAEILLDIADFGGSIDDAYTDPALSKLIADAAKAVSNVKIGLDRKFDIVSIAALFPNSPPSLLRVALPLGALDSARAKQLAAVPWMNQKQWDDAFSEGMLGRVAKALGLRSGELKFSGPPYATESESSFGSEISWRFASANPLRALFSEQAANGLASWLSDSLGQPASAIPPGLSQSPLISDDELICAQALLLKGEIYASTESPRTERSASAAARL